MRVRPISSLRIGTHRIVLLFSEKGLRECIEYHHHHPISQDTSHELMSRIGGSQGAQSTGFLTTISHLIPLARRSAGGCHLLKWSVIVDICSFA